MISLHLELHLYDIYVHSQGDVWHEVGWQMRMEGTMLGMLKHLNVRMRVGGGVYACPRLGPRCGWADGGGAIAGAVPVVTVSSPFPSPHQHLSCTLNHMPPSRLTDCRPQSGTPCSSPGAAKASPPPNEFPLHTLTSVTTALPRSLYAIWTPWLSSYAGPQERVWWG